MAYNTFNSGSRGKGAYNNRGYYSDIPEIKEAISLPADYVEEAERVIRRLAEKASRDQITTSKIRNLMALVMDVYNKEQIRAENTLLDTSIPALQMLRIRIVYEAGRDQMTKFFVEEAKLLEYLKDIGTSREKLVAFAHYMEALVAYHRFYHLGNER